MPRRKIQPVSIDATVLAELARMRANPKAGRGILKYAGRRARMLARAGNPVGIDEASILVADAITDTLTGVVSWDRRQPFGYHLRSIIRARTANRLKRARERRHVSLEALDDRHAFAALPSIEGAQAPARPDALFECAHVVRQLYGAIHRRSKQDAHVTALLEA